MYLNNNRPDSQSLIVSQIRYLYRELHVRDAEPDHTPIATHRNHDPNMSLPHGQRMIVPYGETKTTYSGKRVMYSRDDYDQIATETKSRTAIGENIQRWSTDPSAPRVALLQEPCGSGKSRALASCTLVDPSQTRYVCGFHTRINRDAFADSAQNAVVVYGNVEIITRHADETRRADIEQACSRFYAKANAARKNMQSVGESADEKKKRTQRFGFDSLLKVLRRVNLIDNDQRRHIRADYDQNRARLSEASHLIMTTQKLKHLTAMDDTPFTDSDVLCIDEVTPGDSGGVQFGSQAVYGADREISAAAAADDFDFSSMKVMYITAESVMRHELTAQGIDFEDVSSRYKMYTPRLEIVMVSSTTGRESRRQELVDAITSACPDAQIIANAVEDKKDFDIENYVAIRGRNDLKVSRSVVVASFPAADRVARVMCACDMPESEAVNLIMSDDVNQAIGRNMGHRDHHDENRCLVVVPGHCDLDLDFCTDKVVTTGRWRGGHAGARVTYEDKQNFSMRDAIDAVVGVDINPVPRPIEERVRDEITETIARDKPASITIEQMEIVRSGETTKRKAATIVRDLGYVTKRRTHCGQKLTVIDTMGM